jgi:hypothetical protein
MINVMYVLVFVLWFIVVYFVRSLCRFMKVQNNLLSTLVEQFKETAHCCYTLLEKNAGGDQEEDN